MKKISKMSARIATIYRNFGWVISDPERKSLLQMCWEFLRCCVANRCIAVHYLTSYLYRRDVHNIFDYIPIKEERAVQDKINDPRVSDIVTNKLLFVEFFERGGFAVPRLLGYNILDKIYTRVIDGWDFTELSSPQMLKESLQYIMTSWGIESIFLKEIRGNSGVGAYLVTRTKLQTQQEIDQIYSSVSKNYYVFQEVVEQHPDLSKLNPNSLNTMRIDTFRAPGDKAEILSAFLRVGGKGKNVDNVGSGGVLVGIHLESGKLKEKAFNFFHGSQTFGTFITSPASGVPFAGFQVPLFDKVKETVIKAAEFIPSALVGWDVAVGPSGPVLIESNLLYYGVRSSDMAYGGYRKNPVYNKVTDYVKNVLKK